MAFLFIFEKMDLELLHNYLDRGLLIKQVHSTLPIAIWNYSETVQWENAWDEITLMCRGLVTDFEGNIVARPFPKFFNIGESKHTPTENFEVFEKMDGSLGIAFFYAGNWIFCSRGSFTSDQAIKGNQMFQLHNLNYLDKDLTYCFEIIYPENRIVCDYGDEEDLVMLSAFSTKSGNEIAIEDNDFTKVKKYDCSDIHTLKELNTKNAEGFVVRFSNGDRCKIKFEDYLYLHRIMTNVTTTSIWECLKNGEDIMELLKDVPDEFYNKVREFKESLEEQFKSNFDVMNDQFYSIIDKKLFAERIKDYPNKHLLFSRLHSFSERYVDALWDNIKPEFKKL